MVQVGDLNIKNMFEVKDTKEGAPTTLFEPWKGWIRVCVGVGGFERCEALPASRKLQFSVKEYQKTISEMS